MTFTLHSLQILLNKLCLRWLSGVIVFLLISINLLEASEKGRQEIILATGSWPPYTSESLENYGLASQIVTEAFAFEGINVKFRFLPWKRSLASTRAGLYDGTFPWQLTPERKKQLLYSEPLLATESVFFHRNDWRFYWKDLRDITNLHIGVTRGYAYSPYFREQLTGPGTVVSENDSDRLNLKLLLNQRIDLFPVEKNVGIFLLHKWYPGEINQFTYHPRPIAKSNLSLLFPKSRPESNTLLKTFNRGLAKLKSTDRYHELLSQASRPNILKIAFAKYPPWKTIEKNTFGGIDAEIVREVGRRLEIQMEFVECPWKRCVDMIRTGAADLITSFGRNEEREEFAFYLGNSYAQDSVVFYRNKDSEVHISSYQDLSRYSIGTTSGSSYFEKFNQDDTINKTPVTEANQLIEMLANNRLDAIIGYEKVMDFKLATEFKNAPITKEPFNKPAIFSFIAMSKQSNFLFFKEPISQIIDQMLEDGTVKKILEVPKNQPALPGSHSNGE